MHIDVALCPPVPRRYPYFGAVVRLVWSYDPESYVVVSHAGQAKGDNPDKKGYPDPPSWGVGRGVETPPRKKP
jgi:hypothetical protein